MKPKKHTGNKDSNQPPVSSSEQQKKPAQAGSGNPESYGGSREGNVGHETSPEGGRGDRQV